MRSHHPQRQIGLIIVFFPKNTTVQYLWSVSLWWHILWLPPIDVNCRNNLFLSQNELFFVTIFWRELWIKCSILCIWFFKMKYDSQKIINYDASILLQCTAVKQQCCVFKQHSYFFFILWIMSLVYASRYMYIYKYYMLYMNMFQAWRKKWWSD